MFADLQQVPSVGPAGNSPERTFQRLTRFEQRMCAAGITSFAQVPIDTHHASIPDDRNHLCCNHLRQSATAIDIHSVQCRHSRRSTRRSFCQWDHSGPPQIWWTLRTGEFDLARRRVSLGITAWSLCVNTPSSFVSPPSILFLLKACPPARRRKILASPFTPFTVGLQVPVAERAG